jgi:hypothetical protein
LQTADPGRRRPIERREVAERWGPVVDWSKGAAALGALIGEIVMTEIHERPVVTEVPLPRPGAPSADDQLRELLKEIARDKRRAVQLVQVEVKQLTTESRQQLGQLLTHELAGQLPAALAQAVAQAQVGTDVLTTLCQRLANAYSTDDRRLGQAATAEAARAQASDGRVPQQALRWTQFVQRATHVPGASVQSRAGSAAPKGEMAAFAELLGQRRPSAGAAGLRTPRLVERALADLTPGQRAALMQSTFGDRLASVLMGLGMGDPLALVKAGALPGGRAALAGELGMERGKLLALLMRVELLKIGPGRSGELGVRPDLLGPLARAGVAGVSTLAALRSLPADELGAVYRLLRQGAGGFARAVKNQRPPLKRDLVDWTRTAARRPSDILLADADALGELSRGDAQELVTAWYLEGRLWDALARRERDEEEARDRRGRERDGREDGEREEQHDDDPLADLEYDKGRDDRLMCFWITDHGTDPTAPRSTRRMYVCVDPATGAILPQQVEAEVLPALR